MTKMYIYVQYAGETGECIRNDAIADFVFIEADNARAANVIAAQKVGLDFEIDLYKAHWIRTDEYSGFDVGEMMMLPIERIRRPFPARVYMLGHDAPVKIDNLSEFHAFAKTLDTLVEVASL